MSTELAVTLADAGLVLAQLGQGDMTRGHLSARLPGQPDRFLMKPHGYGLDEITPENILTINLEGEIVAGSEKRHSEVFIHTEIYRARPDVQAVIHTHPAHLVALSGTTRAIRPFSHGGATFLGLPLYNETIDLIRTPELGRGVAAALGPHRAVLLKSHGVVMTGRSLEEAVILLYMLENAAETQLAIQAAEQDVEPEFPQTEIDTIRRNMMEDRQFGVNFHYLVRQAKRERRP